MSAKLWTILSAVVLITLTGPSEQPKPFAAAGSTEREVRLDPGTYRLTLRALEGRQAGHQVSGLLNLRAATCEDRSEQTAERIESCESLCLTPIYGWTNVDLRAIGAAVSSPGSTAPDPSSRDPLHPGVLEVMGNCGEAERGQPRVLAIGTVLNRRVGSAANDGPGILVHVLRNVGECLDGTWYEGGRAHDAAGSFRACRFEGPAG